MGNCGTLVSFRVGAEDAPRLARALDAPESELATLSRGRAYVRTLRDGQPTIARPMEIEMATLGTGRLAAGSRNTQANFARPRKLGRTSTVATAARLALIRGAAASSPSRRRHH